MGGKVPRISRVRIGMYRANAQPELPDFRLPFGGKHDPVNHWVKLVIDDLHAAMPGKVRKPRTCRKLARGHFLAVALSKIRTAVGKQPRPHSIAVGQRRKPRRSNNLLAKIRLNQLEKTFPFPFQVG